MGSLLFSLFSDELYFSVPGYLRPLPRPSSPRAWRRCPDPNHATTSSHALSALLLRAACSSCPAGTAHGRMAGSVRLLQAAVRALPSASHAGHHGRVLLRRRPGQVPAEPPSLPRCAAAAASNGCVREHGE